MMRKLICMILLLLLLLTGCAAPVPEEAPTTAEPAPAGTAPAAPAREEPAATAEPPAEEAVPRRFTDADTAAMSSYMSANRWLIDGERFFGLDYDGAQRPVLASFRLHNGQMYDYRVLCRDCVPEYLCLRDGRLYFLHEGGLQRLDLKTRQRETLLEGPLKSLQLYEGALYLTDAAGRYFRTDLDGQNSELLLEGPCDYAWAMPEGILYQDEAEGACLRLRLLSGEDRRLTAAASFAPLRIGDTVWYSQRDSEGSVLASVALGDGTVTRIQTEALRGAAELIPTAEGWTLRVFLAGDAWRQQLLRPGETAGTDCAYSGYRLCDCVGESRRIDAACEADGRLRCFVLAEADGSELRFLGGEILG